MKIRVVRHHFFLLCILLLAKDRPLQSTPLITTAKEEVWLTVFVHGIVSITPYVTVTNFPRFLTDNLEDSPYGETVTLIRKNPFFFQNQTIQAQGLVPIELNTDKPGAAASALATFYDKIGQLNSQKPTKNYYYTYGWSGLLSRSARCSDALKFIQALEQEIAHFRSQGIDPKIRLVGYSHGGTVILKLALVKRQHNVPLNFAIDETIFLGTPIQFDTDYLIEDPLYKKVYNIFSRSDRVQKLDFFSCGQFFSDQVFKPHCGFEQLPDKLTQIEIRMIRKKGEACLPLCVADEQAPLIYDGKKCIKAIRNVSPGHGELWFFGWTPLHYRKTFVLYPFPFVTFLSFILNTIRPIEHNFIPEKPIAVTIDVRRNSMIINNNICPAQVFSFPFIGISQLIALKNEAMSYQPNLQNYNRATFYEQIIDAYEQAIKNLHERRCHKKSMLNSCH